MAATLAWPSTPAPIDHGAAYPRWNASATASADGPPAAGTAPRRDSGVVTPLSPSWEWEWTWRWSRGAWAVRVRAAFLGSVLAPALRAWCQPLRVEGAEPLAGVHGPLLIVANHASHLDAPLVLAALPAHLRRRTVVAAAEDTFYRRPAVALLASVLLGTFPFPRSNAVGLDRAAEALSDGWNVLLFPEGTRSRSGAFGPFKRGAARLLLSQTVSGREVRALPVGIRGAHESLPPGSRHPARRAVLVRFGTPWRPTVEAEPASGHAPTTPRWEMHPQQPDRDLAPERASDPTPGGQVLATCTTSLRRRVAALAEPTAPTAAHPLPFPASLSSQDATGAFV